MDSPTIREAQRPDLDKIIALFRQSERLHVEGHPDVFSVANADELLSIFEKFMADAAVANLVVEIDGLMIGYARYRIYQIPKSSFLKNSGAKQALIEEIVISEDWRRHGLARELILEIERRLRTLGIEYVKLSVFAFNKAAQGLYAALDYSPISMQLGKHLASTRASYV